jgi:hypothetical protein
VETLVCEEFEQYTAVGEVEEASGDEGSMAAVKDVSNVSFPTNIIVIKHADYDAMLLQAGGNIGPDMISLNSFSFQ